MGKLTEVWPFALGAFMGYRDDTQGFAFVYSDLQDILAQKDQPLDFHRPSEAKDVINFPKKEIEPKAPTEDVEQIKKNLDRLQILHQKLHVILDELNQIKKKK